jgi:hypothetical protein
MWYTVDSKGGLMVIVTLPTTKTGGKNTRSFKDAFWQTDKIVPIPAKNGAIVNAWVRTGELYVKRALPKVDGQEQQYALLATFAEGQWVSAEVVED